MAFLHEIRNIARLHCGNDTAKDYCFQYNVRTPFILGDIHKEGRTAIKAGISWRAPRNVNTCPTRRLLAVVSGSLRKEPDRHGSHQGTQHSNGEEQLLELANRSISVGISSPQLGCILVEGDTEERTHPDRLRS